MLGDAESRREARRRRQVVIAAVAVPAILAAAGFGARYVQRRSKEAVVEKAKEFGGPVAGAAAVGALWLLWRLSA